MNIATKMLVIIIVGSLVPVGIFAASISGMVFGLEAESLKALDQFGKDAGEKVGNTAEKYLERSGEETVLRIATENAIYLRTLIKAKNITTIQDLVNDPDIQKVGSHVWYGKEYVWIGGVYGDKDFRTLVHPLSEKIYKKHLVKDLHWNESHPDLLNILQSSAIGGIATQSCGYYVWGEVYGKPAKKYLCNIPIGVELLDKETGQMVPLLTGTGAYFDSYFKDITASQVLPGESVAGEMQSYIEETKKDLEDSFSQAVFMTNVYLAIAIVVIAAIVGVAAYMVINLISKPLDDLAKVAEKIGSGDISSEIPHREREDEIGVLARNMEGMRRSLEIASETLKEI
ncbi:MAG: HAMP domain-containing protein [Archaeoglobus sp.]|nr:HAMP domain-containing protein [Archaeoglobus sp.]